MARQSDSEYDATPDFVYAVSLLASLEDSAGQVGHAWVLPLLGMARAELVDFGRRRPDHFVETEETSLATGLVDLDARLTALLSDSDVLQETVRLEAARRYVRRALAGDLTGERGAESPAGPYEAVCSTPNIRIHTEPAS
ncbi:MAG: hypothetical protein NTX33_00530 [Propionibacteriales bacterium]|nr:hypothetical protein [Propionibacteriales bacterium]